MIESSSVCSCYNVTSENELLQNSRQNYKVVVEKSSSSISSSNLKSGLRSLTDIFNLHLSFIYCIMENLYFNCPKLRSLNPAFFLSSTIDSILFLVYSGSDTESLKGVPFNTLHLPGAKLFGYCGA